MTSRVLQNERSSHWIENHQSITNPALLLRHPRLYSAIEYIVDIPIADTNNDISYFTIVLVNM